VNLGCEREEERIHREGGREGGGREGGREGGRAYLHRGSLHQTVSLPAVPRSSLTKGVLSAAAQLEGAWTGTLPPPLPPSLSPYLHRGSLHNTVSAPAFPRSRLTNGVVSAALQFEGAWTGTPIPAEPVSTRTSIIWRGGREGGREGGRLVSDGTVQEAKKIHLYFFHRASPSLPPSLPPYLVPLKFQRGKVGPYLRIKRLQPFDSSSSRLDAVGGRI